MCAAKGAISRARARASRHREKVGEGLELGELKCGQLCVLSDLTHAWQRASSAAGQARRDARGGGRDRARARAHVEIAADGLELGEIQRGQLCVLHYLTHAWPRASSAAGQARRDARGGGRDSERGRGRAHVEMAADGLELGEIQRGQRCVVLNLTNARPRASSAAGEARCDARGGGRDQPSADEGARAHRDCCRRS